MTLSFEKLFMKIQHIYNHTKNEKKKKQFKATKNNF